VVEGRPLAILAQRAAYVGAGGDLGLERDSSAIAIVSSTGGMCELLEFDEVRPAKDSPLAPSYVIRSRFAPVMRKHGVKSISMDAFYRQSAREHLIGEQLEFTDAPTGIEGKYSTYMHVRGLLREGLLRLPNSPRLLAQMRAVVATPISGGRTKIHSPRRAGVGGHGDIVSALVLAAWGARRQAGYRIPDGFFEHRTRGTAFQGVGLGRGSSREENGGPFRGL
jgi:hypothetical protein